MISEPVAMALALVFWLFLATTAGGCGPNARGQAQTVLSAQATILVETEGARHDFYDSRNETCLGSSDSLDAWRECMAPAYAVARAADTYDSALRAAQASLDASDAQGFEAALPCLVEAASRLAEALSRASIPIPESVRGVLALGAGLTGACEGSVR